MPRCPTCTHPTDRPTLDVYHCTACNTIWCDRCGMPGTCPRCSQETVANMVLCEDAYC